MEQPATENNPLNEFLDFLYEGLEGYVYLAASNPKEEGDWKQEFFKYPTERQKLVSTIRGASKSHEVYIGPALFSAASSLRSNFKVSNVVWTEFDGNAPDWNDTNIPSLVVQSSGPNNQHVYWKLTEPVTNVDVLEDINRRITYNMSADASAWDANQVLRPPETTNYKNDPLPVGILSVSDNVYDIGVFEELAPAPKQIEAEWELSEMPSPEDVILRYSFTPDMVMLLKKSHVDDRSASLMNLAYGCAQMGLTNNEIMALLILKDDAWGKFKNRKDRLKRLSHIITVAKNKYPSEEEDWDSTFTLAFGFQSFLDTDIEINWLIEPMLMEQGNMLLVGPSGVGKTQITLDILVNLALGKDFLHYKVPEAKKIILLSLEMGHGELKVFVKQRASVLTEEELALLETNLIIVPHGEPWFINTPQGQEQVLRLLEEYEPDGLVVDSIGSALNGNISSDEVVQPLTQFNDKIRKKYGMFTWYIHHIRKQSEGQQATQDDVYGNQYILNRSTSTYAVLRSKGDKIKVKNFKNRLAPREKDYFIERDEHLIFHSPNEDVDKMIENNLNSDEKSKDEGPSAANGLSL